MHAKKFFFLSFPCCHRNLYDGELAKSFFKSIYYVVDDGSNCVEEEEKKNKQARLFI